MDIQKVDLFMMAKSKFFPTEQLSILRERLLVLDEKKWEALSVIQFHDPVTLFIVSLLAGALGVDRFMIGDNLLGFVKLLTCGGFWIGAIVDLFLIQKATKEKNMEKILQFL